MRNTRRKLVYWVTYAATLAVGLGLTWALYRPRPGHGPWMLVTFCQFVGYSLAIATGLATLICRRLGLSLDVTTTEGMHAAGAHPIPEGELVIGQIPWWSRWVWPVTGVVAIAGGIGSWAVSDHSWDAISMAVMTTLFICVVPVCFMTRLARAATRLDRNGITRTHTFGMGTETVAWSDISRCELRIRRDALDRIAEATIVLFDPTGKELSKMDVTRMPEADRQQLLETLRGGPAATELEAAEAPAGRGSEPEAHDALPVSDAEGAVNDAPGKTPSRLEAGS